MTPLWCTAPDAKIDGLIRHSDPDILRCFHLKHTDKELPFNYAAIKKKTKVGMKNSATQLLETDVTPLHIYVTNPELKGDLTTILASDDVVVTRAQLAGFFGRTFADRIGLMDFRE